MEKLRIGLVGCGGMMCNHARAVNSVDTVEIVAVCDIARERAEKVAEALGNNPKVYTDYMDMADYVDAVLVALPHDLHYECGAFFARKKKHVMMEKPLCNTEEECLSLINICEENDVVLMCAYPVRFWPGVVKLKDMIDSGEWGRVIQMSIWTEQYTHAEDVNGRPDWSNTARIGGGQFFSHGCHYVDVMLWMLGEADRGMHFGTRVGTEWLMREGTSSAIIHFKSGAVGYHGATWAAKGTRMGYDFQIHTEKGLLEYDHNAGEIRIYDTLMTHKPGTADVSEYRVAWKRPGEKTKETQYEIAHFADCVKNHKLPLTNGYSALNGLRAIWRMYEAEKTGIVADLSGLIV